MSTVFPFDLPGPTALYVTLYIATLAAHVAFMSYVLAGSGYVAAGFLFARGKRDAVADILRDWLPFCLGGAITAGVAPLLFIQLLYKESFYTANLLLFHRWMAMIPILVAGFYLLYLGKSKAIARWGPRAGAAASLAAFACFAMTAYSWTENHMLALDSAEWPRFYAAKEVAYVRGAVALRTAMWLAGALPMMIVIVAWQARHKIKGHDGSATDAGPIARRLAVLASVGLVVSAGCGALYYAVAAPESQRATISAATAHLAIIAVALVAQLMAWGWIWRARRLHRRALQIASLAAAVAIVVTAMVREAIRMASLGDEALFAVHARIADSGGLVMFLIFLAVNAAIIAGCLRMVRRGLRQDAAKSESQGAGSAEDSQND